MNARLPLSNPEGGLHLNRQDKTQRSTLFRSQQTRTILFERIQKFFKPSRMQAVAGSE